MTNSFYGKLIYQSTIFVAIGAGVAYFTLPLVPSKTGGELLQVLGGITAIGGSLLGWSAGWLDQSRSLIKEIDYSAVEDLSRKMRTAQTKLIWRWGIALSSSLVVVVGSVIIRKENLNPNIIALAYVACLSLLSLALFSVASLFSSMLASSAIRARLEDFEMEELRKTRNTPKPQIESNLK